MELDLSIDENNLMEEWRDHPAAVLEYGILSADADEAVDEAKAAFGLKAAAVETDIRANPGEYHISKITESVVSAAILQQPEYRAALEAFNKTKAAARLAKVAVEAIGQRKYALQGMTDLFMRQWFADPKARETHKAVIKKMVDGFEGTIGVAERGTQPAVDMTKPPKATKAIKHRGRRRAETED